MKNIKNLFLPIIFFVFDLFFAIFISIASPFFYIFNRLGARRLPLSRNFFRFFRYYPLRDHYYQPDFLFSNKPSAPALPPVSYKLIGDPVTQKEFLSNLIYSDELENLFRLQSSKFLQFDINNKSFGSGDAEFLYQFIRYSKPQKVIEIGSGNSTKISSIALVENFNKDGINSELVCIEPYEQPWLEDLVDNVVRLPVQHCDLTLFSSLKKNDLLFIDSSHILNPFGDVHFIYKYILPLLNQGVFIHIHDIFIPNGYLKEWEKLDVRFWNEQYVLECILSSTNRYKVIAALNYLSHNYPLEIERVCPFYKRYREPGSFYMVVN